MTRPMAANEAPPEAFVWLDLRPPSPRVTASQAVASSSHSPSVQTRFPSFEPGTTFAGVLGVEPCTGAKPGGVEQIMQPAQIRRYELSVSFNSRR
jgi:hypothetical protein